MKLKKNKKKKNKQIIRSIWINLPIALSISLMPFGASVKSLPQGGNFVDNSASISTSGNEMNIHQLKENAIINWESFNVAADEHVRFIQPSSSSVILNRVLGNNVSEIYGRISANGRVFITNPHGIIFGEGANINVGSLLATTAHITDADFMNGNYTFNDLHGLDSQIINYGNINIADEGYVALLAPQVENAGYIQAKYGTVALISGRSFSYDGNVFFKVEEGVLDSIQKDGKYTDLVKNSGEINADGGNIVLGADVTNAILNNAINLDGIVMANSIQEVDGKIVCGNIDIHAENGTVIASADISAKGDSETDGGDINITGENIVLGGNIDASGKSGGEVIVFADDTLDFDGAINAAGFEEGPGGFVETSGKKVLNIIEGASVKAGSGGLWLLDPEDIDIDAAAAATIVGSLDVGTNVTVETDSGQPGSGNITVYSSITKTAGGDATLTLRADNDIYVIEDINSSSGKLNIILNSDYDNSGAGGIFIDNGVDSNNGNIIMGGGLDPTLDYAMGTAGTANTGIYISNIGRVNSGAGNISMMGQGQAAVTDSNYGIYVENDISSTTGNITMNGIGGGTGASEDNNGIWIDGSTWGLIQITTTDGAINLTGQGGNNAEGDYNKGISAWNTQIESTGTGTITIEGTGGGAGTSASNYNYGISLGLSSINTANGAVDITGQGGTVTTGYDNYGIYLYNEGQVVSTGSGTITLDGTGGGTGATSNYNRGVYITGSGSKISTATADIDITAHGANTDDENGQNFGLYLENGGQIESIVSGNITIDAIGGGTGTTEWNPGVLIRNSGSKITTTSGDIDITAVGGAGYIWNDGLQLYEGGVIESTGSGNISIDATGGGAVGSDNNNGIIIEDSSSLVFNSGSVTLKGTRGIGSNSDSIEVLTGTNTIGDAAATGDLTFIADDYKFANLDLQTAGNIIFKPETASTTIGVNGGAGDLSFTDASFFDFIDTATVTPASVTLGDTALGTGAVTIADGWEIGGYGYDITVAGGDITVSDSINWTTDTTLTLDAVDQININADITATGDAAGLVMSSGNVDETFNLNNGSSITLSGATPTLTIDGASYTVINDINALQDMDLDLAGNYAIGSNINASATSGWNGGEGFDPVGDLTTQFTGNFDGLGNTISDLYINRPTEDYIGLFGYINGSTISNTGMVNIDITGNNFVGGLVGQIENTKIINSYTTGHINSGSFVGGLVGQTKDSEILNSYSNVFVNGGSYAGGLVGLNWIGAEIKNSHSSGTVNGATFVGGLVGFHSYRIENSYSSGYVSGTSSVGGLVGENTSTVTNSYWNTETSGQATSDGGTGRTTAQMMQQANFGGFNFGSDWAIVEGTSLPYLQWQYDTAPQIITGILDSSTGGIDIQMVANGTNIGTSHTGANGYYYFATNSGTVAADDALMVYLDNTPQASAVYVADGGNMTGIDLTDGYITLTDDGNLDVNSVLSTAIGTISDANALYSASGNVITINGNSIFESTTGNITVSDDILKTAGGDATLTLKANNSITMNSGADISSTSGALDIILWANSGDADAGYISLDGATINSNGGDVVIAGGADTNFDEIPDEYAWGTTDSTGIGITLDNTSQISTGIGSLTMLGQGEVTDVRDRNYGVYLANTSSLSSTSGAMDITGMGGGTGVSANNYGFYMELGADITTADGNINITGESSPDATGNYNVGAYIKNSDITSTGSGNITIDSTGGTEGASYNYGTWVYGTSVVSTVDGIIDITGLGGANAGTRNDGVFINGEIESTGLGTINIDGTGGGTGGNNYGVFLDGSSSKISSVNSDINITAQASTSAGSDYNYGFYIEEGGIESTGSGNINIDGTGGGTGGSDYNRGFRLRDGAYLKSASGNISITGTMGNGANSVGLTSESDTTTNIIGDAAATGDITLIGDSYNFVAGDTYIRTSGNITFKPETASTTIGIKGGAGDLSFTDASFFDFIDTATVNPASVTLGDTASGTGAVNIGTGWDLTDNTYDITVAGGDITADSILNMSSYDLTLQANSTDITLNDDITKTAGGDATLTLKANNSIDLTSGADITSTSDALDTILWSNAGDTDAGYIKLDGATITSNGGNIVLGGGLDDGANGGVAADGRPDNYAWGTAANKYGVGLAHPGNISADTGNITIMGHGWNDLGSSQLIGINLINSVCSLQTTSGDITLIGIGGDGTGSNNGINNSSQILTDTGNIYITGTAGTNGVGYQTNTNAQIISTGTGGSPGSINITGYGAPTTTNAHGIYLVGGIISSLNAPINLTGIAGAAGGYGIRINGNDNDILSTGNGTFTFTGTSAGTGTYDLSLSDSAGFINTIGGASATGDITFVSDNINPTLTGGLDVQTAGDIIFSSRTAGNTVGVAGGAGDKNISIDILDSLTAGDEIIIGDANTADITANTYTWDDNVQFYSGLGSIDINGNINTGAYNLTLSTVGGSIDNGINAITTTDLIVDTTGVVDLQNITADSIVVDAGNNGTFNAGSEAGSVSIDGINLKLVNVFSDGAIFASSDADITINSGGLVRTDSAGNSIVLVAAEDFTNNSDNNAISAPNGRWLVYSTDPVQNVDGGLTYTEIYATTYVDDPPGTIPAGNYMTYSTGEPVSEDTGDDTTVSDGDLFDPGYDEVIDSGTDETFDSSEVIDDGSFDQTEEQTDENIDSEESYLEVEEETSNDETSGEDQSGEETSNDETSGEDQSGEETSNDETSAEDQSGEQENNNEDNKPDTVNTVQSFANADFSYSELKESYSLLQKIVNYSESEELEYEADRIATDNLVKTGYSVVALKAYLRVIDVLEFITVKDNNKVTIYKKGIQLNRHPDTIKRIIAINSHIDKKSYENGYDTSHKETYSNNAKKHMDDLTPKFKKIIDYIYNKNLQFEYIGMKKD